MYYLFYIINIDKTSNIVENFIIKSNMYMCDKKYIFGNTERVYGKPCNRVL